MDYKTCPSLPAMFFAVAAQHAERPFLSAKHDGAYRSLSWRDTAERISALSRALRALGIQHGDRVALIAENRPEWFIADFAVMAAGAITVPAYTTNTVEDHRHILANKVITGRDRHSPRLQKWRPRFPHTNTTKPTSRGPLTPRFGLCHNDNP